MIWANDSSGSANCRFLESDAPVTQAFAAGVHSQEIAASPWGYLSCTDRFVVVPQGPRDSRITPAVYDKHTGAYYPDLPYGGVLVCSENVADDRARAQADKARNQARRYTGADGAIVAPIDRKTKREYYIPVALQKNFDGVTK